MHTITTRTRTTIALSLAVISLSVLGCRERNDTPLENAGRRGDEIVDNVKKGKPPLHKNGPLERAGEAIDETLDGK